MRYSLTIERLADGRYRGSCDAGREGVVEAEGTSRDEVVARIERAIRYRLELCPCSRSAEEYLRLDVRELAGPARR